MLIVMLVLYIHTCTCTSKNFQLKIKVNGKRLYWHASKVFNVTVAVTLDNLNKILCINILVNK